MVPPSNSDATATLRNNAWTILMRHLHDDGEIGASYFTPSPHILTRIVEPMISRRSILLSTLAAGTTAGTTIAAAGKMTLAMHQNTSAGAGYRNSLEGW